MNTADRLAVLRDQRRAQRVRAGQRCVDTPVECLRVLLRSSAHGRTELRRALGEATVEALLEDVEQRAS